MAHAVIDIATGKKIVEEMEMAERKENASKGLKRVFEMSAPDGRIVFSIGRLLKGKEGEYQQNKVAA